MTEKSRVIFRTVTGFTIAIKGVFGDPNKKEQAEKHLLGIRQRGSIHEYTAEFYRYSMRNKRRKKEDTLPLLTSENPNFHNDIN
ncbi:uncharacterized protein RAG0_14828 [Rhynchosporium agropyri]|uniref:Retrotransposon gag domain-containing protein n=1 Tax=Rhynchosporium agropyri TaxID=914238 RepID=A0A1E1LKI2_9HELO|nr:uncharacterized protein RAG0_14828 [Rhynchosporium agropyri]